MNHFGVFASLAAQPGAEYFCNRLAARDVRTGKLEWELGGPGAARQPDTFFLGPPLPLMGQLYVLADVKAEIHLLALNPATGDVVWSQPVAAPPLSIAKDPMRRWSGHVADLCRRHSGLPHLQRRNRRLRLGHSVVLVGLPIYGKSRSDDDQMASTIRRRRDRLGGGIVDLGQHRVILTPVDSESIYCLNLSDGQLLWKCPRQPDDLYVACVDDDKVVVVGRSAVRAVRLADGKPAWDGRSVNCPTAARPAAWGSYLSGQYLVPLTQQRDRWRRYCRRQDRAALKVSPRRSAGQSGLPSGKADLPGRRGHRLLLADRCRQGRGPTAAGRKP